MEGQGEGWCGVGSQLEIFLNSGGDGIGHVSKTLYRINVHSFIVEVKLKRRRWRPGRRGGCLTPLPMKPYGKNISKHIKNGPLRRSSNCITFMLS